MKQVNRMIHNFRQKFYDHEEYLYWLDHYGIDTIVEVSTKLFDAGTFACLSPNESHLIECIFVYCGIQVECCVT